MEPQPQEKKKNGSSSSLITSRVQAATIILDTPPPTTTTSYAGEQQPEFAVTLRCHVKKYTKGGPGLSNARDYHGGDAEASFVAAVPGDVPRGEDGVRAVLRGLLRAITPLRHLNLTDGEWEAILPQDVVPQLADLARGGLGVDAVVEMEVNRDVRYSAPRLLLTGCREVAAAGGGDGGECSICYEPLCQEEAAAEDGVAVELPGCAHAFHRRCISKWFGKKPTCPLCRGDVTEHLDPELRMHLEVVFCT